MKENIAFCHRIPERKYSFFFCGEEYSFFVDQIKKKKEKIKDRVSSIVQTTNIILSTKVKDV